MTLTPVPDEPRGRTRRPTATARFGSSPAREPRRVPLLRALHPARDLRRRHRSSAPPSSTSSTATTPATWPRSSPTRWPSSSPRRPTSRASSTRRASARTASRPPTSSTSPCSRDVFAECKRVLEPGGRIAVNVANLGRRPYRSLAGDVTEILQDLGLLLRGEVVWWKGRAAGGSCAWGTFQRPSNPVLRDVTERIVIASKGRFDRALTPQQRAQAGPAVRRATISRDEFLEATTDLWEIPPESATRVGHPAPFPVAAPQAAHRALHLRGRRRARPVHGVGQHRGGRRCAPTATTSGSTTTPTTSTPRASSASRPSPGRGRAERRVQPRPPSRGPARDDDAERGLPGAGGRARDVRPGRSPRRCCGLRLRGASGPTSSQPGLGIEVNVVATDQTGGELGLRRVRRIHLRAAPGSRRTDTLWKALGKAAVLHEDGSRHPAGPAHHRCAGQGQRRASAALKVMRGPGQGGVRRDRAAQRRSTRARLREYARRGRPDR